LKQVVVGVVYLYLICVFYLSRFFSLVTFDQAGVSVDINYYSLNGSA